VRPDCARQSSSDGRGWRATETAETDSTGLPGYVATHKRQNRGIGDGESTRQQPTAAGRKLRLLRCSRGLLVCMQNGLTEEDMQRISEFQSVLEYERTPEMLVPDDETDTESSTSDGERLSGSTDAETDEGE
jgi:hypothetical protein